MKSSSEILSEVDRTFSTRWSIRDGRVVPDQSALQLGNDGVKLDATVLYADMTDSTDLVDSHKDWFAAEIYKTYLLAACHVIRNNGGSITAFDGDRVMSVFIGDSKNSVATKTALQICYIVREINSKLKVKYPESSYRLQQAIGVDTGQVLVARTGIRNSNDLVWVGSAANHAAKLCDEADESYRAVISDRVYSKLNSTSKMGGNPKQNMWKKHVRGFGETDVYRSNWYWQF